MTDNNAQLVMVKGPRPGETYPFDEQSLVLGRDPRNAIVIDHPEVSRRHARVRLSGDAWLIEDLDSTNGTFVNGALLRGIHALEMDDVISLSETVTLAFRREEPTGASAPRGELDRPYHPSAPRRTRHGIPDQPAASIDARAAPHSGRRQTSSPLAATRGEPRKDRTWLWIAAGCVVLLLVAICATLLILSYLGLLPALSHGPRQALIWT
jgi:predicted component of type VI protein secretion system